MGFFSEIRTALNEIFAEFSQDVQFRDKTYKCIIGENGQHEVELESGGFVANETFTATPPSCMELHTGDENIELARFGDLPSAFPPNRRLAESFLQIFLRAGRVGA